MAARTSRTALSVLPILLVGAVALSGCSKATAPEAASTTPTPSSSAPTSSSAAPSVTATPTPTVPASLGGRCDNVLPVINVDVALGKVFTGTTAFVLGVPEPDIGRLAYLNCRYGIPAKVKGKPDPVPQVEVGISLYKSVAQAASRVEGTVEDFRIHSAISINTRVDQYPATILLGDGQPTIVVAAGPRTVAASVTSKLAPSKTLVKQLTALAKAALDGTAKFTGGPVAAAPSTTP